MGLGVLDMVIALEQLARADQSLAVSVMVSVASGLTLGRFGDAELARKYLPDIVAGRKICGIAGTEPNAGSDTSAFTTRASQRGNGWRLNGEKAFHHQWRDRHQFVSDDPCRLVAAGCGEEIVHAFPRPQRHARIYAWRALSENGLALVRYASLLSARLRYRPGPHYRTRARRTDRAAPRLSAGARVSGRVFARLGASLSRSLADLRQGAQGLRRRRSAACSSCRR